MKESEIRPQDLFNRYLALAHKDSERLLAQRVAFVPVTCPACGDARQTPRLEKLGFSYVMCDGCGTLYLSPRPSPEQLDAFYRDAESVKFWSTHFYKETAEARREKLFRPRAQLVDDLLTRSTLQDNLTFVDVGSGYGIFLEEIQRLGKFQRVMGIEPNPDMAEICRQRGFPIVQKALEAVQAGEVQSDVATAFEVLEHVFDPLEFLTAARRVLKPNGILLFTTLTVSGFDIQVLWEHSKSIFPPHHINLISVEGMRRLVKRSGLDLVELSTPGELDVDIVRNIVRENPNIEISRFVHQIINAPEKVRASFQAFLKMNELSSHIRVIARQQV